MPGCPARQALPGQALRADTHPLPADWPGIWAGTACKKVFEIKRLKVTN